MCFKYNCIEIHTFHRVKFQVISELQFKFKAIGALEAKIQSSKLEHLVCKRPVCKYFILVSAANPKQILSKFSRTHAFHVVDLGSNPIPGLTHIKIEQNCWNSWCNFRRKSRQNCLNRSWSPSCIWWTQMAGKIPEEFLTHFPRNHSNEFLDKSSEILGEIHFEYRKLGCS